VYRNIRAHNPVLASLYAVAAVFGWYDLATYGGRAVIALHNLIAS
jgi:hypothetical protein